MKTLHKLFAAVLMVTLFGVVGCADQKKSPEPAKSPENHGDHGAHAGQGGHADHSHDQGKTPAKTPAPTEAKTTPEKTAVEVPTPGDNPDVEKVDEGDAAESGSTEKKGGVDIPKE